VKEYEHCIFETLSVSKISLERVHMCDMCVYVSPNIFSPFGIFKYFLIVRLLRESAVRLPLAKSKRVECLFENDE